MTETTEAKPPKPEIQHYWLIYLAAILSAFLLLADAVDYTPGTKVTARLGIALLYTALAFMVAKARPSAYIGTTLLWLTVVLTFAL